jgi:hypothetical protein
VTERLHSDCPENAMARGRVVAERARVLGYLVEPNFKARVYVCTHPELAKPIRVPLRPTAEKARAARRALTEALYPAGKSRPPRVPQMVGALLDAARAYRW